MIYLANYLSSKEGVVDLLKRSSSAEIHFPAGSFKKIHYAELKLPLPDKTKQKLQRFAGIK